MLRDVDQVHVTKYQDKRFYVNVPETQPMSLLCQGLPISTTISLTTGGNDVSIPSPCRGQVDGLPLLLSLPKSPPQGLTWVIPSFVIETLFAKLSILAISVLPLTIRQQAQTLMAQEACLSMNQWASILQQQDTLHKLNLVLANVLIWVPVTGSVCGTPLTLLFVLCVAICKVQSSKARPPLPPLPAPS